MWIRKNFILLKPYYIEYMLSKPCDVASGAAQGSQGQTNLELESLRECLRECLRKSMRKIA